MFYFVIYLTKTNKEIAKQSQNKLHINIIKVNYIAVVQIVSLYLESITPSIRELSSVFRRSDEKSFRFGKFRTSSPCESPRRDAGQVGVLDSKNIETIYEK